MSFAAYDVERRTRKGSFYAQVDTIIDWKPISAIIDKHYQKGLLASSELPEEEVEKQDHFFKEVAKDGVDKEARWLKKGIKTYFGYKKQIAVDSKTVWRGSDEFKGLGQGTHNILLIQKREKK
ncbi:hypothetical protein HMPREF9700_01973 [Bergeyella zoohelcum CCUG 30536]|uniref:Transposase n=2 Tax=Bergeyella zoohelcum TaxID=1015 RepID=A0A376C1K0_9FLAO|nr:hypothetical protein HMPREF9700_01973 [Bergeyella zoohelcum CCUG 30536]SSZ55896.1 Uncharacterised protein [Bergeyella zoohelcum]